MKEYFGVLDDALNVHLFSFAGASFTVGSLVGSLVALFALLLGSRWVSRLLLRRLLIRGHLDLSTRETISSLTHYVILAIGVVMIIDGVGIKLSSFTVLAGALGVGVGFGLQNIFSNFISGLIVMFERPVKLGDHIVVAGAEGDVVEIGMRASRLLTAQGSIVIVPNQSFITGNVVNWAQSGISATVLQLRMMGKAEEDEALLLGIARSHPKVVQTPPPGVFITAVDHAGHVVELHFWLGGDARQRQQVISDINRSILGELASRGQSLAANP